MNYNRIILGGRLTRDPELSYTPNNTAVCKFGMAVNRKWKEKDEVMFIDVTAWGKTGETINEYLNKGDPVLIEGRLQFDQWEHEGRKHSKHVVVADSFSFVGGKADSQSKPKQETRQDENQPPIGDDDIPF